MKYMFELTSSTSFVNCENLMAVNDFYSRYLDDIDFDLFLEKLYARAKKVIITCSYCGSHNAVSNSNCVSCGAGMGDSCKL